MDTRFIVMVRTAKMPASCKGRYVRVAVVGLEPGFQGVPKMISERARGVQCIARTWERQFLGLTDKCAAARARRAAEMLRDMLNRRTDRNMRRRHPHIYSRRAQAAVAAYVAANDELEID